MLHRASSVAAVLVVVGLAACGADDGAGLSSSSSGGSGGTGGGSSASDSGSDAAAQDDAAVTPPSDSGTPPDAGAADAALGPDQAGQATYYNADGTGACGFPASTNLFVAAMNGTQYKKADCGRCVAVTGPKGSTVVRIVDLCPGCKNGGLDLSTQAFSAIANLSAGRVAITWHFVTCP
jgi:expansin (peptidoglycan-binding protein)